MSSYSLLAIVALVLGSAGVCRAAPQLENPYREIAVRNVFSLRPRTPVQPGAPPTAPLPTITLTGITTILGDKRAFLVITPPPKSAHPQTPMSCTLAEGQRDENVEVLQIDPEARSVKVLCSGTVTNLTFEKNGRKAGPQQPALPRLTPPARQFPLRTAAR